MRGWPVASLNLELWKLSLQYIAEISLNEPLNRKLKKKPQTFHPVHFLFLMMVNFTLRSMTNEMISISTSQTFRSSWAVIFHLRRPMAFLSLKIYDTCTPGLAPRMNVFILGTRRLSSKLLKQGFLLERLKSSFRKFYGRYGDLIQQYEVYL